jgi:hypothetical protein
MSFKVSGVFERRGKHFVFQRIVFKPQRFCLEGLIEARADMVGFVDQGSRFFSAFRGFAE